MVAGLLLLIGCSDEESTPTPTTPPPIASAGSSPATAHEEEVAQIETVVEAVESGDASALEALIEPTEVDCAGGSPHQTVQYLCETLRTDTVRGLWIGDVEAVFVGEAAFGAFTKNALARMPVFFAAVRGSGTGDGVFPPAEIGVVFRATGERGEDARDTFNIAEGRIVSVKFTNADFSDDELRDGTNAGVIIPAD